MFLKSDLNIYSSFILGSVYSCNSLKIFIKKQGIPFIMLTEQSAYNIFHVMSL